MKKKVLLSILFILIFSIGSVNAAGNYTSFKAKLEHLGEKPVPLGAEASTLVTDNGNLDYTNYVTYENYIYVPGSTVKYPAYCIDPGKGVVNDVTCELLDASSYPMLYAAASDPSLIGTTFDATTDIVFRVLGMQERQSVVYSEGGGLGPFSAKKNNVALTITWHRAALDAGVIATQIHDSNKQYLPQSGEFQAARSKLVNYAKYWNGGTGGGGTPPALVTSALPSASYPNGNYFTLDKIGGEEDAPIYRVKAKTTGVTDVQIVGEGNTSITMLNNWNGSEATFQLFLNGACTDNSAVALITGVIPGATTGTKMPYMCIANGDSQSFVTLMPGNSGDRMTNIPVKCNKCKEQKDTKRETPGDESSRVDKDHVNDHVVNLCCASGPQKIEEYTIDELFLSGKNDYIEANKWTNKCNNSVYQDKDLQGKLKDSVTIKSSSVSVEDYCKVYCVESIQVSNIPGPIVSASGKYFKLTGSPKVEGEQGCTIKIDYRKMRATYEKAINGLSSDTANSGGDAEDGEIYWYNEYQRRRSYYEMIQSYDTEDYTYTQTPSDVNCSRQVCTADDTVKVAKGATSYTYKAYNADGACESESITIEGGCQTDGGCEYATHANATQTNEGNTTPPDCDIEYYIYTLTPPDYVSCGTGNSAECKVKYYKIKSWDDFKYSSNKFKGLEIKNNGTGTETYPLYTYKYKNGDPFSECKESKKSITDDYPTSDGWACTGGDYNKLDPDHDGYTKANTPKNATDAKTSSENAKSSFDTSKNLADDMEELNQKCSKFFETVTNPYDLHPTANFHYMQVFLDKDKNKVAPEFIVPYNAPSCSKSKSPNGEINSNKFKNSESMVDVTLGTGYPASNRAADSWTSCNNSWQTWDKAVRKNEIYKSTCTWGNANYTVQMTLYPGPQVSGYEEASGVYKAGAASDSGLTTAHEYQYALYLTDFTGTFETWWDFHNLGGTSNTIKKFTKAYNTHPTCAEQGSALSKGTAENLKNSINVVPFTCTLNVRLGGMRIGFCNNGVSAGLPCEGPYEINEVFEFRVVDPKNIFPGGEFTSNPKLALNWKKNSGGWGKTYEAIKKLADLDKTYAPESKTYSFKLNTKAMNTIKEFNRKNDYNSFDQHMSCSCNKGPEADNCGTIRLGSAQPGGSCGTSNSWNYRCYQCKSDFLSYLSESNGRVGYDSSAKNLNYKVWNGSKSLSEVRNANHWAK